jgi:hypothetical protein
MECLAELYVIPAIFTSLQVRILPFPHIRYTANRQPGKALPFFLRLRRPNVFDLIRENNLFTDVQDQALLLVEFDHELMERRKKEGLAVYEERNDAITLLVDHIHSIPVSIRITQCTVLKELTGGFNCRSDGSCSSCGAGLITYFFT